MYKLLRMCLYLLEMAQMSSWPGSQRCSESLLLVGSLNTKNCLHDFKLNHFFISVRISVFIDEVWIGLSSKEKKGI